MNCDFVYRDMPVYLCRGRRTRISSVVTVKGVFLRVPLSCTQELALIYVQKHRTDLLGRYRIQQAKGNRLGEIDAFRLFCLYGVDYPVTIGESARLNAGFVSLREGSAQKDALMLIANEARAFLPQRLREICARLKITPPRQCSVRLYRSRWGACTSTGEIKLSTLLVMLPTELIDYVICHELAHLRVFNHSKKFWQVVRSYCPDMEKCKKQLKEYSGFPRLYGGQKRKRATANKRGRSQSKRKQKP